jgi:hypothetical protein
MVRGVRLTFWIVSNLAQEASDAEVKSPQFLFPGRQAA